MQMPAARIVVAEGRETHEAREIPVAATHLARRRAEQHEIVGDPGRVARDESALDLARSVLVLHGPEAEPE